MALALTRPGHLTARAAATGLAALLLTGLTAPSAPAAPSAPSATVVLDPDPTVALRPYLESELRYGSTVRVELPPTFSLGANPSATFSTDSGSFDPTAAQRPVTDLGGGRYEVSLPGAAAFSSAPHAEGFLTFSEVTTPAAGARPTPSMRLRVDLSGTGAPSTSAGMYLYAEGAVPGVSVAPGATLTLSLPTTSRISSFGFTTLDEFGVEVAGAGSWAGQEYPPPALAVTADGRTASVTVPTDTTPGEYYLEATSMVVERGGSFRIGPVAVVDPAAAPVTAAPVAAAPVRNAGLRSATGWEDHVNTPADQSGTPWLALGGAAALLTAGAVTTATLRRRPTA